MTDISLLDAALAYAAREYPVFPCKNMPWDKDQHKAPLTKNGFKDATTDPVQIKRWWTRYPDALIGIPTGAVSRFAVLDLDKKNGKDGFLHVPDWREISSFIVQTGSGGAHLYFRDDERLYTVTNALGLSGVDIRAKGGYIIAPPSPGYTVIKGNFWEPFPKWPEHLMLPERPLNAKPGAQPQAHIDDVRDALAVIPNDDATSWDTWKVKVGMPTWAATGGSAEGFEAFRAWSEKSGKYDPRTTEKAWDQISHSPPDSLGFGSLFYMAREADPEWEMRWRQRQDDRWRVMEAQIEAELVAASAAVTPELIEEHLAWVRDQNKKPETVDQSTPETSPPETAQPAKLSEPTATKASPRIILSSAEFVGGLVPPDYLIVGFLQRQFLYSMTGQTGSGKTCVALRLAAHVALGLPLNSLTTIPGKVLYLAGENPEDVCMRWIKLCEEIGKDPSSMPVDFVRVRQKLSIGTTGRTLLDGEAFQRGPYSLVIVDTSVAYFEGTDENDNVEAVKHAHVLRSLTELQGGPTVVVTCHPVKNPDMTALSPRGGGAFVNEVDGNLVVIKNEANMTVELTHHIKFRGDFAPMFFELKRGTTEKLKDSHGNLILTVTARPISATDREALEKTANKKLDRILGLLKHKPGLSYSEIATALDWKYASGDPNKSAVERLMRKLKAAKLVERFGDGWTLTPKGNKAVNDAPL